jgi:hypothetical protein
VKRNQFTKILPGLINHNFFYVVYGDFTIYRNDSDYTFCTRSDDGSAVMFSFLRVAYRLCIPCREPHFQR